MHAYRSNAQIAADEYASAIQTNRKIGTEGNTVIAQFLGLFEKDEKWISPDGRDMTGLCNASDRGGFESEGPWTLNGWTLDDWSMAQLRAEFPGHFAHDG